MKNGRQITPEFIYKEISKHIIGQEKAKRSLSIAFATHFRRIEDPSIQKSNILLVGPTGSGKTEMARSIAKTLTLPIAIADATALTAHGYVGEDVESILYQLMVICDWDVKQAENGVIFLDEIDKLGSGNEGGSGPQIATTRVQQALLKMIEGGKIKLTKPGNKKNNEADEIIHVDTSNILFVCAGAFPDLLDNIENKRSLGIHSQIKEENPEEKVVDAKKLQKFGFIPELLGRLPVIVSTDKLTQNNLYDILTKTENALTAQYKRLMSSYGVCVEFSQGFLKSVAEEAYSSNTGARGLRSIMEKRLETLMFEGPSLGAGKVAIVKSNTIIYQKIDADTEKQQKPIKTAQIELPEIVPAKELVAKKNNKAQG